MEEVRMLKNEEHGRTRKLWERVFAEDTRQFLDYYYTVKTKDNEIYVIEQDKEICSMIQLNPYPMWIGGKEFLTHYIIAVATEERFRRKGFMGSLLRTMLKKMYDRGEPFTFLMPAAEKIYRPYDFRYIYRQEGGNVFGRRENCRDASEAWEMACTGREADLVIREASGEDCRKIAAFANGLLSGRYQVFAVRTEQYYRMMLAEQKSENGGIGIAEREGEIAGVFFFAKEEHYEIREPIFKAGEERILPQIVYWLTKEEDAVCCDGWNIDAQKIRGAVSEEHNRPLIMARLLNLEVFLESLCPSEAFSFAVEVADPILEGNNRRFLLESNGERISVTKEDKKDEKDRQISIACLTQILFGWEPEEKEQVAEELLKDLAQINPVNRVFLNEIV